METDGTIVYEVETIYDVRNTTALEAVEDFPLIPTYIDGRYSANHDFALTWEPDEILKMHMRATYSDGPPQTFICTIQNEQMPQARGAILLPPAGEGLTLVKLYVVYLLKLHSPRLRNRINLHGTRWGIKSAKPQWFPQVHVTRKSKRTRVAWA